MTSIKLIKPSKDLYKQYKEMMDEWYNDGSRIDPWPLRLKYSTEDEFNEMLNRIDEVEKGINLDGYASSTTYWLYDEDNNKIIGASNLRHFLDEIGGEYWGHIGYGIRPTERKKGYGTLILTLTLDKAKKLGLEKAYLGAYEDNIGSWKIMEKCSAVFDKIVYEKETNLPIKKYYIDLK